MSKEYEFLSREKTEVSLASLDKPLYNWWITENKTVNGRTELEASYNQFFYYLSRDHYEQQYAN